MESAGSQKGRFSSLLPCKSYTWLGLLYSKPRKKSLNRGHLQQKMGKKPQYRESNQREQYRESSVERAIQREQYREQCRERGGGPSEYLP